MLTMMHRGSIVALVGFRTSLASKPIDTLDVILDKSDTMEETTLMRTQMKAKERMEKEHLLAQLEEDAESHTCVMELLQSFLYLGLPSHSGT